MDIKKQVNKKGCMISEHRFRNSTLVRDQKRLYYLKWHWTHKSTIDDIIYLTREQYTHIKSKLLLPVSNKWFTLKKGVFVHFSNQENDILIKEYLIQINKFKEKE